MIAPNHPKLSVRRQCKLLEVNRNRLKKTVTVTEEDCRIMADLDVIYLEKPFYGQRKLLRELRKVGWIIGRKRVGRLMQIMDTKNLPGVQKGLFDFLACENLYKFLFLNENHSSLLKNWTEKRFQTCGDFWFREGGYFSP